MCEDTDDVAKSVCRVLLVATVVGSGVALLVLAVVVLVSHPAGRPVLVIAVGYWMFWFARWVRS